MNHGPRGIQQERRLFEIGEETASGTGQRSQGKIGKNCSWKHKGTCQNCGTEFAGRKGAANRFCRNDCQHEFSVKRWLNCSLCHAAMGLGGQSSGKLLGVAANTVNRQWRDRGIKSQKASVAGWHFHAQKAKTAQKEAEESPFKAYKEAAMDEIRQHRSKDVYPCWSVIWDAEKNRRAARDYYNNLDPEVKKEKMAKAYAARMSDPEKRKEKNEYMKEWSKNNPEKRRVLANKWRMQNPEKVRIYRRKQEKAMRANPKTRALLNLRSRLKAIMRELRQQIKGKRKLIGCSIEHFTAHIESKFQRGMSWENYGTRWHIDHIVPVSKFDHAIPAHVRQCWHYSNLQPLWAEENLAKSDNIERDTQLCLTL